MDSQATGDSVCQWYIIRSLISYEVLHDDSVRLYKRRNSTVHAIFVELSDTGGDVKTIPAKERERTMRKTRTRTYEIGQQTKEDVWIQITDDHLTVVL